MLRAPCMEIRPARAFMNALSLLFRAAKMAVGVRTSLMTLLCHAQECRAVSRVQEASRRRVEKRGAFQHWRVLPRRREPRRVVLLRHVPCCRRYVTAPSCSHSAPSV